MGRPSTHEAHVRLHSARVVRLEGEGGAIIPCRFEGRLVHRSARHGACGARGARGARGGALACARAHRAVGARTAFGAARTAFGALGTAFGALVLIPREGGLEERGAKLEHAARNDVAALVRAMPRDRILAHEVKVVTERAYGGAQIGAILLSGHLFPHCPEVHRD